MSNLKIYCVTDKKFKFLENTKLILAGVGKEEFSDRYLKSNEKDNIFYKEKFYSELTFHYWYWKNILPNEKYQWVGFCQKRRFWIKDVEEEEVKNISQKNLNNYLLNDIDNSLNDYDSFLCNPIKISGAKKMKLLKRGWKNLIKDPSLLFKTESINLHFDLHHGYKNLEKASSVLNDNDRDDFLNFINDNDTFNPHIMCISRPKILDKWFKDLFVWLKRCEDIFGFNNLKGYDKQRIYAYLAERYLPFWFRKYTKYKELPWVIIKI